MQCIKNLSEFMDGMNLLNKINKQIKKTYWIKLNAQFGKRYTKCNQHI